MRPPHSALTRIYFCRIAALEDLRSSRDIWNRDYDEIQRAHGRSSDARYWATFAVAAQLRLSTTLIIVPTPPRGNVEPEPTAGRLVCEIVGRGLI